jgi:hypothetical protein
LAAGVLYSTGFLRNMVFSNASWTYKDSNLTNALDAADTKMAATLNSTDPDLKAFHARGGKLIVYHGWSDAAIPPTNAISYYQNVSKTMGDKTAGSFVRLYMVPGMQHCAGGPGPNAFGQIGIMKAGDAQHDIFSALVNWVEKDAAPNSIVATKFTKDNPANPVAMTRPLCPYPQIAKYDGKGNSAEATSFVCSSP